MRTEQKLMDGWEFTLGEPEEGSFAPVRLPHDWAVHAPVNRGMEQGEAQGFLDRWGVGWYRRKLELAKVKEDCEYLLGFDGVYENSTVWVNGVEAGGRKYGYSGFALDITGLLRPGENQILVRVDNSTGSADRWYSGAGIYRTVRLLVRGKRYLDPEEIQIMTGLTEDGGAEIRVLPGNQLSCGESGSMEILAELFDEASGEKEVARGKALDGVIRMEIKQAKLWSPEEPNLYRLKLTLSVEGTAQDVLSYAVGIREICLLPQKGMYLNGSPIKLKGVCVHQDAGCLGIAAPAEIWRERLLKLKGIGCNAIRAAHHVFAPEFLGLCDELGFLVYEEPFDKWTGGSYGRYFETEWRRDLEFMVRRDRNHACVFMWGTGNEVEYQGQESMLKILGMLTERVRALDGTRPVSYAMNPHFKFESDTDISAVKDIQQFVDVEDDREIRSPGERLRRIGRIGELVDVICCNYQEQWYPAIHEAFPDKLILGTEIYQYFKGHEDQLQNLTEEVPWLDAEKYDYCIGGMLWTGIDYLGESMGYPSKGWSGSLLRTNGERRPLSYLYESYWSGKPMVYFSVMDYTLPDEMVKEQWDAPRYASHWNFSGVGRAVIPYMIATNCEEAALYLNGKRYYVKRPDECPNRLITGFLPYQPGEVTVKGYRNQKEVCSYTLRTAGKAMRLLFDAEESGINAEEGFTKLFTVRAVDSRGTTVYHEDAGITFLVSGPAELIGVDNGNLLCQESYAGPSVSLYGGCASAALRMTGEPGRVSLTAVSEGLEEGRIEIEVKSR